MITLDTAANAYATAYAKLKEYEAVFDNLLIQAIRKDPMDTSFCFTIRETDLLPKSVVERLIRNYEKSGWVVTVTHYPTIVVRIDECDKYYDLIREKIKASGETSPVFERAIKI